MPPTPTTPWFWRMDAHGETPLSRARRCGYQALAELLLSQEREYARHRRGESTELHRAAYWGLSGAVGELLAKGVNPSERDVTGNTPLMQAVRNGHREVVEALLRHDADVNVRDDEGFSCLHWVALNGRGDIAELLLEADIDVNPPQEDKRWPTPAGMALLMGYQDLVQLFSTHGGTF